MSNQKDGARNYQFMKTIIAKNKETRLPRITNKSITQVAHT